MSNYLNSEEALFGRSIDDFLLYDSALFSDKEAHEFKDKYIVEISVPGFKPENLELEADNDTLILRGFEITKQRRFLFTRITKIPVFQRSLVMPLDVAPNTIAASYHPGVVKVTCPKQLIPFNHNRNHYLVQSRKIKIQEKGEKNGFVSWFKSLFSW